MGARDRETISPGLRVELFVEDLAKSRSFYSDVLKFDFIRGDSKSYCAMRKAGAMIGLNLASSLSNDHPVKIVPNAKPGLGVEIVLVEDDVDRAFDHARSKWSITSPLKVQLWGLRDFRLIDPDGYYIRVTGMSAQTDD